ncbi:MAG: glycosyl hydrolase family 18 protein [Niabella sp.]
MTGHLSCEEAVVAHVKAGMPLNKLVLGIPFYGRGNNKEVKSFIHYKDILNLEGFESKWDDVAKAHYLINATGDYVCSYETSESVLYKCNFIKQKGMLGAMYWEYAGDTEDCVLGKLVYDNIIGNKN